MSGDFYLFCGPSIDDLRSPPFSSFGTFHHEWSRFDLVLFINMMHIKTIQDLSRFWRPPSRVDLVLQVKPTSAQTLLDVTSSFHPSKQMQLLICAYVYTVSVSNFGTLKT